LPIKLIVSGTGISLVELEDVMASGVSKPAEGIILFHNLGMFDTWLKLKPFLERYIPTSFLETPSGYCLQKRFQEYLLGRSVKFFLFNRQSIGLTNNRYRFSTSFLEYFLRNGLRSPHKLLNEYIKGHTACLPGDSALSFTLKEPKPYIAVRVIGFEWDRLQEGRLILSPLFPPRSSLTQLRSSRTSRSSANCTISPD
jgi:hypothetical protein